MLYVTGDTHNERLRFTYEEAAVNMLKSGDKLIVAGDFGFVFWDTDEEQEFRQFLAKKPYQILFVDGNHENHDLLNSFPVEILFGGKVHVIARDDEGAPKVIHLMRGQIYTIEGKKVFTFGGGFSIDRVYRKEGESWWSSEMPSDEDYKEAIKNLELNNFQVDFIVTHAAPE